MGVTYAERMLTAEQVSVCNREGVLRPTTRAIAFALVAGGRALVQGPNRIRMLWGKGSFPKHIRERDGFICTYCGQFGNTVDHVRPRSRGGLCTPANCVCACRECNSLKGSLSIPKFVAKAASLNCTCYTYTNGIRRTCQKHRILERAPGFVRLVGNLVQNCSV